MSKKLLILGAKGAAKKALEAMDGQDIYSEIAFLDNYADYNQLLSYPIIGKCDDLEKYKLNYTHAFVCITDTRTRMYFIKRLINAGYQIPNIIHPLSYISKSAEIASGIFVNALAVIQSDSKIGNGCLINTGAVVEHDNQLGECVNISSNVTTTGNVIIDKYAFIGAGTTIINSVHIGENVLVAAGSAVITDIPKNVMVAGCPAKIKKSIDIIKYKKDQVLFNENTMANDV